MRTLLPATHPLDAPTLADAQAMQFRLVESVCAHFTGRELLQADFGVTPELGRPAATARVEEALADFFGTEACALAQGAGTGAIRSMLAAALHAGDPLLIHDAPPYQTTIYSFEMMGLKLQKVDFNDPAAVGRAAEQAAKPGYVYVQHARHRPDDSYPMAEVIQTFKSAGLRVLTDENYAVFKVHKIGVEMGADASTFSMFKMLGPEGIGCIVGRSDIISRVHEMNYSGGGQVQGPQALDALRSLITVPVLWAVQAMVVDEVADRLRSGEVPGIASVGIANAQDRLILVQFEQPVAKQVVEVSARFGAQNYPVGANSRYEVAPWVYRLSGSSLAASPELTEYAIRINPVRGGADLIIDILKKSLAAASEGSRGVRASEGSSGQAGE